MKDYVFLIIVICISLSEGGILKKRSTLPTMSGDCLFYNPLKVDYVFDRAETNSLVSAQVIFRHSARAPTIFFPTDTFAPQNATLWPNGLGQLTDEGEGLASQLGHYIRVRYNNFLAENYTEKEVFVQCSDVPRAIETVQLMLETLFLYDSKFDINIIEKKNDNKIQMRAKCNERLKLYFKYIASKDVVDFYEKAQSNVLFTELSKLTGKEFKHHEDVGVFGATIWSECQRGLSEQLPAWVKKYYPGQTQAFRDMGFNSQTNTPKLARFVVGSLFSEMLQSFKVAIGSAHSWSPNLQENIKMKKAKLYVYSGHEATIYAFLNSLKLFDKQVTPMVPLYTAAIFFELHCPNKEKCISYPRNEDNYIVKVFYKQRKDAKAQLLTLDRCPMSRDGCTLKDFEMSHYHLLFRHRETKSHTQAWIDECNNVIK